MHVNPSIALPGALLAASLSLAAVEPVVPVPLHAAAAVEEPSPPVEAHEGPRRGAALSLAASEADPRLASVLAEVLARNPALASLRARAAAAAQVAPQARKLPDPMVGVRAWVQTPETDQAELMFEQALPPRGRRAAEADAASREAEALAAEVEARAIELVTRARRAWHEVAWLDASDAVLREERDMLRHFEEMARARYASGEGLQQDAIKIQAEISRVELSLLELASARAELAAELAALRAAPGDAGLAPVALAEAPDVAVDPGLLAGAALEARPELAAASARIAASESRASAARAMGRPELTLGVEYGFMRGEEHGDKTDLLSDGDELALTMRLSLPVRRRAIAAGVEQAVQERLAGVAERASLELEVRRDVSSLAARLGLARRQLELNEGVLSVQAEEALRSAEHAYGTGALGSIDLLDAVRVLYELRLQAARVRADLAILAASLEGACGFPLRAASEGGAS